MKRPGVAIRTSTACSRFSVWVLCRNPPVTTIDRKGTPNFDIDRQSLKTCSSYTSLRSSHTAN
uniref:Uncharacterized protein n=1 Tax=Rhizophora mucronata TaxID=61149 RepID=A0A2P2L3G7_RHIMU